MNKIIQRGLVLLVFAVPLIFSHSTIEVYGLIKVVVLEVGVLALLALWLIQSGTGPSGKDVKIGPLGWAVLGFLGVAVLSLVKATNIHEGLKALYQLGAGVGLFFLVANKVKEKKEVNEIILALILAGLVSCFFSLYENRGIRFGAVRFAYTSTFGNPLFFAQYLSLAMPLGVAMCLQKKSRGPGTAPFGRMSPFFRIFFGLSALFMLVFLLLTRCRGAYLGVAVALLYCYIAILLYYSGRLRKALIGLLIVFVVVLSLGFSLAQSKGWMGKDIRWRNLMRVYLWSSTLEMVKDHPILGVGVGNFKVVYPLYRSGKDKEVTPKGVKYSKAHNDFLQIWAEMGTLGLVCFLGILFSLVRAIRRTRGSPCGHISLGLQAGIIALLVQAFFNPLLYVPVSGMGFWVLLGLLALDRTRINTN